MVEDKKVTQQQSKAQQQGPSTTKTSEEKPTSTTYDNQRLKAAEMQQAKRKPAHEDEAVCKRCAKAMQRKEQQLDATQHVAVLWSELSAAERGRYRALAEAVLSEAERSE